MSPPIVLDVMAVIVWSDAFFTKGDTFLVELSTTLAVPIIGAVPDGEDRKSVV